MRYLLPVLSSLVACATPASAEPKLERGFDGSLRGCEEWLLNPASWANGTDSFVKAVGLGEQMALVEKVEEVNLPAEPMRRANHYWRINSTPIAGYILVVSDQMPMCHITGGGGTDLQPSVESVLSSSDFNARWERRTGSSKGRLNSTVFRSRKDPALTITISRAKLPGQSLNRVQVLATASYQAG